jgi:hypothetical protein
MKSRIRFYRKAVAQNGATSNRIPAFRSRRQAVRLADMPAPAAIEPVDPDQVVVDILTATLQRVQQCSSAEVSAAAGRYLAALR